MVTTHPCKTPSFPFLKPGKRNILQADYKSYTWGCFFSKHNFKPRNPNNFLCKICFSPSDDPHHHFFYYSFTGNLIAHLEPLLTSILKKPTLLTQDKLLFNYTNTTSTPHIIISKLASLIRLSLYNLRNYNSLFNTPIPTPSLIEKNIKLKQNLNPFLNKVSLII